MRKPPVVEVTWIDACDRQGEYPIEDVMSVVDLVTRVTVGYLCGQDETKTIIAMDFDPATSPDEHDTVGKFTVIPTGWVKGLRYITRRPSAARSRAATGESPTSTSTSSG